jgi:hypothetical protein|tara:strand:+ start:1100 stop:2857 length:1758 start_codon:yes stop_codon:yes gene_type:complete
MKKISFIFLLLICSFISFIGQSYAADDEVAGGVTQTTREDLQADSTFTIRSGGTLEADLNNIVRGYIAAGNEIDNATVIVESGGVIKGKSNAIMGRELSGLIVVNSGTIEATSSKAIQLQDAQGATITNKSGGIIFAKTNAIVQQEASGGEDATGTTINNAGTIYGVDNRAIYFYGGATNATVTNESGGILYNESTEATVQIDTNSTLVNSGTIDNRNSPSNAGIAIVGNDNTITLKDKSILVGTIDAGSTTGNTLKFQHGMGQGYYYKTSGDFTLQDLDGNQVVKGSAGSVGQGASETLDELLSYKSINLRNFFNEYKKLDNQDAWGETYVSNLKRDAHTNNLALEYDLTNFGVNLINKIDNANFVIAFEGGRQDFVKDHKIDYQNISAGIYLPQKDNPYFNLDLFILGGITLKDGERTILTNTTTSGKLTIDSDYETYEIHTGIKKNNLSSIPDFGLAASYSMTPSYDESKYFSWTDRDVGNLSVFFEDDYNLINSKDSKLFLGWTLDIRKMMGDKKQVYSINGTSATYKQHNNLTNEISLIANMGYEKKFSDKSKILFSLDAKNTNRYTKSLGANISFKSKF